MKEQDQKTWKYDEPTDHTPVERVLEKYELPFPLKQYQIAAINALAWIPRQGYYAEVGLGKTVMSTVSALYGMEAFGVQRWFVIVPPILIRQWVLWLNSLKGVTAVAYRGTPKQRESISLDAQFIVMSTVIFKNEHQRLRERLGDIRIGGIIDEATCIKNTDTDNYRYVTRFFMGEPLMLLTGTPLSTPMDAYAYIKLLAPSLYRSKPHFENMHVAERDFFGNVTEWGNLDVLAANFGCHSQRLLAREHLPELKEPTYSPIHYELEGKHQRYYEQLAEEQMILLEKGGKLDATTEQGLYQALQQIIMAPGPLLEDPKFRPTGYDVLDETLSELDVKSPKGRKLVVATWYRTTSHALYEYLNSEQSGLWPGAAEMIIGGLTDKQREAALDAFTNDDRCRVLIVQPGAAGKGVDGLQRFCSDMLFMEIPPTSIDFQQLVGRLDRTGQTMPVNIRVAVAEKTVQQRLWANALTKDAMANKIQRSFKDLRELVYGK